MTRGRLLRCSKYPDQPSEDAAFGSRRLGRFAVADGASTSYAGGDWARTLAKRFVRNPAIDVEWLRAARRDFMERARPDDSDTMRAYAFDRGNYSTLLGFVVDRDGVKGFAFGDTVLFLVSGEGVVHYPPLSAADFEEDPVLLSSHSGRGALRDENADLARRAFRLTFASGRGQPRAIAAMTDGLAAWVVRGDVGVRLATLIQLERKSDLVEFVNSEVAVGTMRRDDVTLLVLDHDPLPG